MKQKTLREQRKDDVYACYLQTLRELTAHNPKTLIRDVVNAVSLKPAPRIYTDKNLIVRNVSLMRRGEIPCRCKNKQKMYEYICREVENYTGPHKHLIDIVEEIAARPAPSFFITGYHVFKIIYEKLKQ